MNKSKSPVLMSLGEVLGDFLVGAVVTAVFYFAFLAGGLLHLLELRLG
jgi:hypothetical protein